jgi:hypothetical protein
MALVELDDKHFLDKRFERLGELTGRGKYDARGRIEDLWFVCIKETNDVRSAEEIDNLIGWFEERPFAEFMVDARLAVRIDGGYRIRGVAERMKWLQQHREVNARIRKAGGEARAASAPRDEHGRFLSGQQDSSTAQQAAGEDQQNPGPPPSPPSPPSNPGSRTAQKASKSSLTQDAVKECAAEWLETLRHFKAPRTNLLQHEEELIARAIQFYRSPVAVRMAIIGVRHEPSGPDYSPASNLSLSRVLPLEPKLRSKFERLMNLGVQAEHKNAAKMKGRTVDDIFRELEDQMGGAP